MRRETVYGKTPTARQVEIIRFIAENGEMLARASTSGLHLADEMKARILNTFSHAHEPARKSRPRRRSGNRLAARAGSDSSDRTPSEVTYFPRQFSGGLHARSGPGVQRKSRATRVLFAEVCA